MIQFHCVHCRYKLSLPDTKANQTAQCPKCGGTIHVPPPPAAPKPLAPLTQSPRKKSDHVEPETFVIDDEPQDLPLAEEPAKTTPAAPSPEEPLPTAGGLGLAPVGDVIVVSFLNSGILDSAIIDTIGQELYALVDELSARKIVLDFAGVKFLSSQMLGVLMMLHNKSTGKKGRVLLCSVAPEIQTVFRIANLQKILPIFPDRHTAIGVLNLP